jgi:hypothetical protein
MRRSLREEKKKQPSIFQRNRGKKRIPVLTTWTEPPKNIVEKKKKRKNHLPNQICRLAPRTQPSIPTCVCVCVRVRTRAQRETKQNGLSLARAQHPGSQAIPPPSPGSLFRLINPTRRRRSIRLPCFPFCLSPADGRLEASEGSRGEGRIKKKELVGKADDRLFRSV